MVHGLDRLDGRNRYSASGPLFQAKILLFTAQPNRIPGFAIAGGVLPPVGQGAFAPREVHGFAYLAITESLGMNERVLIHANLGLAIEHRREGATAAITAGVGVQVRTWRGLHAVAELVHGDAYAGDVGGAFQAGLRYIVNDHVQIDSTFGVGTWGDERRPTWGTLGLRLAGKSIW